jgi:uncharacterized phage protein (TIGR01671 family)
MKDRFKQRAYLKNYNRVVEVKQLTNMDGVAYIKFEKWNNKINTPTFQHLEDVVLMQCTGLEDKNGKLIYEGDILEVDDDFFLIKKGVVTYDVANAAYTLGEDNVFICNEDNKFSYYEIIGNKFENPELLKNTKLY